MFYNELLSSVVYMTAFDITNPTEIDNPYDNKSLVEVSTETDDYTVALYYDEKDVPNNIEEELRWEREKVRTYFSEKYDESIESVTVSDSFIYVESGFGGEIYYA